MTHLPDEELKKAFKELHEKVIDTRGKLEMLDWQIDTYSRIKKRAELIEVEINVLPDDTKAYRSVGRMFILQDMNFIKTDHVKNQIELEEKIKAAENNKTYLERSLKESENNIREMVQKRKSQ